jgi:hypothetical protein
MPGWIFFYFVGEKYLPLLEIVSWLTKPLAVTVTPMLFVSYKTLWKVLAWGWRGK